MDYKLEYMTKLFAKISKKRIESYVISRLWHQLRRTDVKFVIQQYINRGEDKYALADLYLPQINLFIEINEPHHYRTENKIEIDKIRNEEISQITKSQEVIEINCDCLLEEIHRQINDVVAKIKQQIESLGEKFRPWGGENSLSVDYHKKKGYFSVDDDDYFRTIDDICEVFGTKPKHKGFLRVGGASHPTNPELKIWWPNAEHRIWKNELKEEGKIIFEYNQKDEKSRIAHINRHIDTAETRIVFFKERDALGICLFRFVGLFTINKEKSISENKLVWERIAEKYKL